MSVFFYSSIPLVPAPRPGRRGLGTESIKPIIILLTLGVNCNKLLSKLVILGFLFCEENPKGLFHIVKLVPILFVLNVLACVWIAAEQNLKKINFKNESGVFILKVLLNKVTHVAAVKYALVSTN